MNHKHEKVVKKKTAEEVVKIEVKTIATTVMAKSSHFKSPEQSDCNSGSRRNQNDFRNIEEKPTDLRPWPLLGKYEWPAPVSSTTPQPLVESMMTPSWIAA